MRTSALISLVLVSACFSAEFDLDAAGDSEENAPVVADVASEFDIGSTQQAINGEDFTETISRRLGQYKEVLGIYASSSATTRSCTATVIGPHAAITANHCPASGVLEWPASSTSFSFTSLRSPQVAEAYWPQWWAEGNQDQKNLGIRFDDWPANHDIRVLYVPGLTAEVLADYLRESDLRPADISAYSPADAYAVVGIQSELREIGDIDYQPAGSTMYSNQQCQNPPRNGYFTRQYNKWSQPGDSGGPNLGSETQAVEGPRHLVAITSNSCNDTVPLAYDAGIALTPEQETTVRLNQLWVRAAASDADRDNIPFECDSNPASTASTANSTENTCPAPLGGPYDDETVPRGLLQCPEGFLVTGVRGKSGWYLDRLQVECTPISCLERGGGCGGEFWTDHFGEGTSASPDFDYQCPAGSVVARITGYHTPAATSGGIINRFKAYCYDYNALAGSGTQTYSGSSAMVGSTSATYYNVSCPDGGAFSGFEARSSHTVPFQYNQVSNMKYITGLQPICSSEHREATFFAGGVGGTSGAMSCPGDMIAVGTVARPYTYIGSTRLGMFGLLCKEPNVSSTSDAYLVAVHGSDYTSAGLYPRKVEKYTTLLGNAGSLTAVKCSSGYALSGVGVYHDGAQLIRQSMVECTQVGGSAREYFYPGIGGSGGSYSSLYCPSTDTTRGMFINSGWLTDGVALRCEDN